MTAQLGLFEARARTSDPETSRDAAGRVDGQRLAMLVLYSLRLDGPATSHQLAERLNLDLVTVSPRLAPLERAGKVCRAGRRDKRTLWAAV